MQEAYSINKENKDLRLDVYIISKVPDFISRNMIQNLIKKGDIKVNNTIKKPSYKLRLNDIVQIKVPDKPEKIEIKAEKIPLNIIFEDDHLIVINKPSNMIVHPTNSVSSGTMVNAMMNYLDIKIDSNDDLRPGIVHRLDKDTSGVIVFAKNQKIQKTLSKQFQDRLINKLYLAIVKGNLKKNKGFINLPIDRNPVERHKMAVVDDGRESLTYYKLLKSFKKNASLISLDIKTGRTHQIRVHMTHLGNPLIGDYIYGNNKGINRILNPNRQMLHAAKLQLYHPVTNKQMSFTAKLPKDFLDIISKLNCL